MNQIDIIKTVEELESELYDINQDLCEYGMGYKYIMHGCGSVDVVKFCDYEIYHSEFDREEDIEDAGGFKEFLIQQRDKFIDMLIKVRKINMNDKIQKILIENGFYDLTRQERIEKHKEFIVNIPYVLTKEEKEKLVKILNEESPIFRHL